MLRTRRESTLISALGGTAETGGVLRTALGVGQLTGMGVEAVQVGVDGRVGGEATAAAHANGVRMHHRHGDAALQLLEVLDSPRVFGAVLGARTSITGPRPLGSTALAVLRRASKPVVFVPPDLAPTRVFVPRRLLVPIDGTPEVSNAVLKLESHFRPDAIVETTVLYTLNGLTPTMVDHPEYDLATWGEELVRRHLPGDNRFFEWRTGAPGSAVIEVAEQSGSDLIVLCFHGRVDVGHGEVVREVLARASVPVFVLPTSWLSAHGASGSEHVSLSAR